jgi:hypothetical protein
LAFIITLSACKKKDDVTTDPTPVVPYFTFAKVGNVANYETSAVIPILGTKTGTMSQTIIEKIGDNIYKVKTVMDLGLSTLGVPATTDTSFWFISGTELADVEDATGANKFMYYTKGDAANKTYTLTDLTGTSTRTILSVNESITNSLGTFATYKIKETNDADANETTFYFNNNAGMVKTTMKVNTVYSGLPITVNIEMSLKSINF